MGAPIFIIIQPHKYSNDILLNGLFTLTIKVVVQLIGVIFLDKKDRYPLE